VWCTGSRERQVGSEEGGVSVNAGCSTEITYLQAALLQTYNQDLYILNSTHTGCTPNNR
jgi:hypothetical protein